VVFWFSGEDYHLLVVPFFHVNAMGGSEEEVDAPSATICYGFRLPSLRDCAGMTVVVGLHFGNTQSHGRLAFARMAVAPLILEM